MAYVPFAYQVACLGALSRVREAGARRALVVMASGLGKTVTAAFDIVKWLSQNSGRVLYLCHQNDILEQACKTFQEVAGNKFTYGYFHGVRKEYDHVTFLFASFQMMRGWKRVFGEDAFSYIVVDESHHTPAETYLPVLHYFKPSFLVGMTATPDRMDLQNIRETYGKEIFSLPLEEALLQNLLTSVDYRVMGTELREVSGIMNGGGRKITIQDLNSMIFAPRRDEEIMGIALRHMLEFEDPRVMVFCSTVDHCDRFASLIPDAFAVHYKMSPAAQRMGLSAFRRGHVKMLVTVDKFNEGIDVPEVNMVVFLRSTASRTIFYQQLGRGLRKAPGTAKQRVLALDFAASLERLAMLDELWRSMCEQGETQTEHLHNGDEVLLFPHGMRIQMPRAYRAALESAAALGAGYPREQLIESLQQLARILKRTPTIRDMKEAYKNGICVGLSNYYKKFGPFADALQAAGLWETEDPLTFDCYTAEEKRLIAELRAFLRDNKGRPTIQDLEEHARSGGTSYARFCEVFGSLNAALDTARIPRTRRMLHR